MSKKQRLILALLAAGNLVVLLLVCSVIAYGLRAPSGARVAELATLPPTNTPRPTPIPTWTPTPTPTPYVAPTPTPYALSEEEAAALDQIEREVAMLRDLQALRPVLRWKVTPLQLRQHYADTLIGEEWETKARPLAIALAALDFMAPDTNLLELWRDSFYKWIAGFYTPDTEEIFLVSDAYTLGVMEQVVFAHEFDHALQDQYFNLEALGLDMTSEPGYSDRFLAIHGLIEGDAELLQEQYVETYISEDEARLWLNQYLRIHFPLSGSTPPVLGELSEFPYNQGRDFVQALYDRGGWELVNSAYAAPPASTEHILHPDRYLAGDQPVAVSLSPLTETLGSGWHLVYESTLGEFVLGLYLGNRLGDEEADQAAAGWGGDRCVVYYNDTTGETAMLLRTVWDTSADARQFLDAYESYADARFGHSADRVAEGVSCWEGMVDVACVTRQGDGVIVVLGPEQVTVDGILAVGLSE
jgi:hypothetical protein